MKRIHIALAAMLIASGLPGADGIEYLKTMHYIDVVTVTPTNLSLKFKTVLGDIRIIQDDSWRKYDDALKTNASAVPWRLTSEFIQNDEPLILPPEQETRMSRADSGLVLILTPVFFKNQQNGFKITSIRFDSRIGRRMNDHGYIALSDTPVQMGDEDVKMIMDKERWERFEPPAKPEVKGGAMVSPPSREAVQPVPQATPSEPPAVTPSASPPEEMPDDVAEDEPSEEKNKASNFWLYVIISFCALSVIFYFLRRKTIS